MEAEVISLKSNVSRRAKSIRVLHDSSPDVQIVEVKAVSSKKAWGSAIPTLQQLSLLDSSRTSPRLSCCSRSKSPQHSTPLPTNSSELSYESSLKELAEPESR
jgi:hypothetical protein